MLSNLLTIILPLCKAGVLTMPASFPIVRNSASGEDKYETW